MSETAELIADMVRQGVSPELIGRVAAALAAREVVVLKDEGAERRREKDRDRKRLLPLDWEERRRLVFERDGYVCHYCGEATDRPHCDHIFPLSRGGSSELRNLVTSCRTCNVSKKDRTPDEWHLWRWAQ